MGLNPGKRWFVDRMDALGISQNEVARRMGIDRSALSRALDGERQVKLPEIGKIATIIGATREEVIDHLESIANSVTFGKEDSRRADGGKDSMSSGPTGDAPRGHAASSGGTVGKRRPLHPGIGFMKGLIKIEPDFDVAAPFSNESWEDGYLGEDRLPESYVGKSQK